LTLRRILVPLDFSGKSRQALRIAITLARQYGAKISLVHAVEHPVYPDAFGNLTIDVNTPGQAAQARLSEMAARWLPAGLGGRTCVSYGSAYANICATAQELKADLIVMSTHGRSGLPRALLGSTAERVVRHAHCSVLTVRRRADATAVNGLRAAGDRLPWERILVPLDFSLSSLRALAAAVRLAQDSGSRLHLLHVVEPAPYVAGPDGAALAVPSPTVLQRAKAYLSWYRRATAANARHWLPVWLRVWPLLITPSFPCFRC
jgi:nucleotide-binding universal stress UspA family protein